MVDDSIVMRRIISDLLVEDAEIDVVGTARNGAEAIEKVRTLNPDVVTMDIEMPVMDGLTALQHIMAEYPRPVVMLSSMDKRQADITFKALELGAVDFIPKTSGSLSLDLEKVSCTILDTVKAAAKTKMSTTAPHYGPSAPTSLLTLSGEWIVLIGCSTGGPKALPEVLSRLPGNLPAAVLVVQHMPEGFTRSFAERLNWISPLEVKEAEEGEEIRQGVVYIAPGNRHLTLTGNKLHLDDGPKVNFVRPAVDVLMNSVSPVFGPRTVGSCSPAWARTGPMAWNLLRGTVARPSFRARTPAWCTGCQRRSWTAERRTAIVPLEEIAKNIVIMLSTGM